MSFNHLVVATENKACWIKLNRPAKRNAITKQMYYDLVDALKHAENDDTAKLTVLTGEGTFYSSGNDFSPEETMNRDPEAYSYFVDALIDHQKPLIALVNGPAIGIACTTLSLCEFVVASDSAYFSTPFPQLGACPEGCSSVTFPSIMGYTKACQMLMFGETLSAQEALNVGFVAKVIPQAIFESESRSLIDRLVEYPNGSFRAAKRLLRDESMKALLHRVNRTELEAVIEQISSEETIQLLLKRFASKSKL